MTLPIHQFSMLPPPILGLYLAWSHIHNVNGILYVLIFIYVNQARIQDSEGGFVQESMLENRSYPDVHDFSLRMQVIIANANNIADSRRGGGNTHTPKKTYIRAC